jgi:hypothetical protein
MEIVNLSALDEVNVSSMGPGIELLMNDNVNKKNSVSISDIDKLETELNSLSGSEPSMNFPRMPDPGIKLSSFDEPRFEAPQVQFDAPSVKFEAPPAPKITPTWDGFKPFQGDPDKPTRVTDNLKEKFTLLRRFEELESRGVHLTRKYTMDSSLEEMKGEYDNIVAEKERSNSVKFQGKMLMACITGVEFLNSKFDPFDIKLDGWAEQLNENITDYDEIFEELHEKYKSKAKMAPEIKLLFQLGGSAMMLHMTNTMFKSSMPGIDDIMRQNPDLMQKFSQAAMNSVSSSSPGFSKFMNTVNEPREREREREPTRPDMKGPSDISDILNGLKPKTVHIDDASVVSASELSEMKDGLMKRGRRKKSDRNTVNLAI